MDTSLIGWWEAVRSDIPGYVPGREWLRFAADGIHMIEQLHPGQNTKSVKIAFTLLEDHPSFVLQPTKKRPDGSSQDGWRISIVKLGEDEIAVTPLLPNHGFTTIYRRVTEPQKPNQAPEPRPQPSRLFFDVRQKERFEIFQFSHANSSVFLGGEHGIFAAVLRSMVWDSR